MNWQLLEQASPETIVGWAAEQPWCTQMAACVQDAEWHAEGDVWTHTKLVVNELAALDEWTSLSPREQTVLLFTAIFHDVAKPLTTEIDPLTGRVTSPKHAVKGEHVARGVLRELNCDLAIREEIARMVRCHGRPVFLLERSNPTHEVVRHSWLVSNRLLYLFALADTRGRDTDSMTRPEENLHLWKLASEEVDCFDRPYPFASPQARFRFFGQPEPNIYYEPHEDYRCKVTMMAGLPGSGKDTWLKQNRDDIPVVSLDCIRRELGILPTEDQGQVIQHAREICREHLRRGESFAFNATNILRQTRSRWIDLFADYNARIEIVYLEPSFERILLQNRNRKNVVPERVILKLAEHCEVPTWMECHDLQVIQS